MADNVVTDPPIEAQDDPTAEADSTYEGSLGSDLTSLSSSIENYTYENGRRYHAYRGGEYVIPNDEAEQERMDIAHHLYLLVLGGELALSPISPDVQRVLDLGTGTGIWALDFADKYPSAQVIGNDLSPIQPKWTPPNCMFEVDDFESPWLYAQPFDLIHGRELAGAVRDYDRLFAQALENLRPGGYLEMQTFNPDALCDDDTLEKATYTREWINNLHEASKRFGKSLVEAETWRDKMVNAGFVDVTCRVFKVPLSPWPKDKKLREWGKWGQFTHERGISSYTYALFTRVLGWQRVEIEVLLAMVRKELKDTSIHQYCNLYIVYGRKP